MINKGQKKALDAAKNTVSNFVSGISQGLGFTTKSLKEMTAKEIKELISDIYYKPGAIEQIENALNGRPDRKGPLSGMQKRIVVSDPAIAEVVKKMCIARALSEETTGTWNNLWEGIDLSGSNTGEISARCTQLPKAVDASIQKGMRDKRTAKGFIDEMNRIMDISIGESIKMFSRVDKAIETIEAAPNNGMKQRAKSLKTVDVPTIPVIEKMNGSPEHVDHAARFYAGIEGRFDFKKMPIGPYTYRELAQIVMTKDSRRCMAEFYRLRQDRNTGTPMRMPQDDKMIPEEKQYITDAKAAFDTSMAKASVDHKNTLAQGQIGSLSAYRTAIEGLRTAEMSATIDYSSVVTHVNCNISQREFNERLEAQRRETEKMQQIQDEHYRKMEEMLVEHQARAAADIQRFLEEFGDELGLNEALRKAEAGGIGEPKVGGKPKEGVAVEEVVVDETAVKTVVAPNKDEGEVR